MTLLQLAGSKPPATESALQTKKTAHGAVFNFVLTTATALQMTQWFKPVLSALAGCLIEHLKGIGRRLGHLIEGEACGVHCSLQGSHCVLVGDRHTLKHLLHRIENVLTAAGKLLAHQLADLGLSAIR